MPALKYKCICDLKINGVTTQTLIDTGATSSAISTKLLECFANSKKLIFRQSPKICVAVNGQPLKSLYTVKLPIILKGGKVIHQEFEVIEGLIHPALLGTDFLKAQEAKLDFSSNSLQLGKNFIPFQIAEWCPPKPAHLTSFDDIVIEPNSISLVRAEIAGIDPRLTTNKVDTLLVGPLNKNSFETDFIASYSIIDAQAPEIWVEVLNPLKIPLHLPKGQPIASIESQNSEISATDMSRDLSKMPSDLSESGDKEDCFDGIKHIFEDKTKDSQQDFVPPNTNFTPVFSDYDLSSNAPFNHNKFIPTSFDNDNLQSGHSSTENSSHSSLERAKPESQDPQTGVKIEEVDEIEPTYVPKAVLTRHGLIELKPQYETLAGLEPVSEQSTPDSYSEIPSDFAVKGEGQAYEPNFDNTILEGENLEKLKSIVGKYPEVFATHPEDLGKTSLMYHYANLTTDKPITANYYRAPPPKVRAEIEKETDRLLAAGIIRESESPYSAPIVLVKKPDGSWRYCTDFRKLNSVTQKVSFPLPNINDSIRRLDNPKVFTSLDLLKGFFQIEVAESQRKYYGFSDGRRHLEYNRTPMGSRNSSATMGALMEIIFRGFPPEYLISYLDDILIATPTVKLHLTYLDKVLAALKRAGLKLNPTKCEFAQKSISVLGFILSEDGIRPDPSNLSKIRDWPAPKNQKQVRQFVGLGSYYRSHVVNFAAIAEPLTDLLSKCREWNWTEKQQNAFETLKEKLLSGTACAYPDFEKPYILKCDSSNSCVGAVLTQKDDRNKECMIACASQKLNSVEVRWAAIDKEFFAIIWGVRQYNHYLRFSKFFIYTDHRPLLSCLNVNTQNDATGKRTRWSLELQSYDFELLYKKGKHNVDADALSRHPNPDPPQENTEEDDIFIAGAMTVTEAPIAELSADDSFVERLKTHQRQDANINKIMTSLSNKSHQEEARQPSHSRQNKNGAKAQKFDRDYSLIDDILYTVELDKTNDMKRARVVVPSTLITEFLNRAHGDLHSGHPGEKRTYDNLSKFAFWPGMRKNVIEKVRSCPFCQASRLNKFRNMVPIKTQKATFPLEFVQADLVKFHPPSHGKDHILVFEDRFTKYCVLYPISGKSTVTVARKFTDFITRFGAPITWGTDNGGEFKSRLVEALCRVYGTKKTFSLAYHPQSNGQTERKNRTIIAELAKRVAEYGADWAMQLPWVQFAYNSTPHTGTKFSPHLLMFGHEARSPFQSQIPPVDTLGWDGDAKNYFNQHQKQISRAHQLARDYHNSYRQQMEKQATKHGVQPQFKQGSYVWAYIPTENRHKLSLHYNGPWEVKEVIGNTYVLKKDDVEIHRPQCDLKEYEPPKFMPSEESGRFGSKDQTMVGSTDSELDFSKAYGTGLSWAFILSGGGIAHAAPKPSSPSTLSNEQMNVEVENETNDQLGTETAEMANEFSFPLSDPNSDLEGERESSGERNRIGETTASRIPVLSPRISSAPNPSFPGPSHRVTRELRKLADVNTAGLKQTSMNDLPAKRASKYRK